MDTWGVLGFIALGVILDRVYASLEWRKYYEGKRAAGGVERKGQRL